MRALLSRVRRWPALVVVALTLAGLSILIFQPPASPPPASPPPADARAAYSLWDDSTVPRTPSVQDTASVEVGLQFQVASAGIVTGVRFFKAVGNVGPHVGKVWSSSGRLLASAQFSTTESGWQAVRFAQGVPARPGDTFTASYRAPRGGYAADARFFDDGHLVENQALTALAGVYTYDEQEVPAEVYQNTNYYVDVLYEPVDADAVLDTAAQGRPAGEHAGGGVRLRQVDGGADYYDKFDSSLPVDPSYFPIGVWFESVTTADDVALDRSAGINLYVELTENSDLKLLADQNMYALPSRRLQDPAVAGFLTSDEADMWAGAGSATWDRDSTDPSKICIPATAKCGYTVMKTLADEVPPGQLKYANYGKGVTFWLDDEAARRFVNDYQDVVSADNYWFTDPNICGPSEGGALFQKGRRSLTVRECRRAANYGATVERVRELVRPAGSKPVWGFVELGHPFTKDDAPTITGPQVAAATWSSIIHGARGIIYFNHNFGGDCKTQHVLRDACGAAVRPDVTALNRQIAQLAPVLNAPFVDGLVDTSDGVDVAAKLHRGQFYLLTASTQDVRQRATLSLACGGHTRAEVVGEERSVAITDGRLVDEFSDANSVHIYRLEGGNSCGL